MKTKRARPEQPIRRPPAFSEYGADMMNMEVIKLMTLAEVGLLAKMRWTIWANDTLPADPQLLARILALDEDEVRLSLTAAVRSFFEEKDGRFVCTELAAQLRRLTKIREAQKEGGQRGGLMTQEKNREARHEVG